MNATQSAIWKSPSIAVRSAVAAAESGREAALEEVVDHRTHFLEAQGDLLGLGIDPDDPRGDLHREIAGRVLDLDIDVDQVVRIVLAGIAGDQQPAQGPV